MAAPDIANTWGDIRQGVKDAETLISQKQYNLSMVKSRQVLELMVNYLCSNASVAEEDLFSSIDALYESQWIDKTTSDHYHKIRMLGNKAVHEGNDDAYDANQVYHLLSQEVYTFANEYKSKNGRPSSGTPRRQEPATAEGRNPGGRSSRGRGSDSRNQRGRGSSSSRSRRRQAARGGSPSSVVFVCLGLVAAVIAAIVVLPRILKPAGPDPVVETSPAATFETVAFPTAGPTTAAVPITIETMAETTPAPVYKVAADMLNVRSEPSTAGEKLGSLEKDAIVDYVEDYDDEWAIINFNGKEAYVNRQFLTHD